MRGGSRRCVLVGLVVTLALVLARGQAGRGGQPAPRVNGEQITQGPAPTDSAASQRTRADQAVADFVRSAASVQSGETQPSPQVSRFRPLPPIVPRGPIGFPRMAQAAGIIFSGTVTSVARRAATRAQAIETVAITFHVEQAIRGATPGENLTISQWIGLWSSGQRYRVGERVLLFLYAPSKLGLTSCVAAPMGRFAVDPAGRVLLTTQHLSAFRADPVLGGKSRARISDFALAVRRAGEGE